MTTPPPPATVTVTPPTCAGDTCLARDSWPLFYIRSRTGGGLLSLCSSCVLKRHPAAFCSLCLTVVEPPEPSAVVECSSPACSSIAHVTCLPNPNPDKFICLLCKNPEEFSYFPNSNNGKPVEISLNAATVMVSAARIALNSVMRALQSAGNEAERKTKEAVAAKRRAKEVLEVSVAERERKRKVSESEIERKAEMGRRVGSREREKWMRLHEALPVSVGTGRSVNQMTVHLGRGDVERREVKEEAGSNVTDAGVGSRVSGSTTQGDGFHF